MNSLQSIFEALEDPRVERTKQHQLLNIILIAILGVLCGAEGWVEIESFGKTKEAWLKTFLDLPNCINIRDGVSSRARGKPSSAMQMSATARAVAVVSWKWARLPWLAQGKARWPGCGRGLR